MLRQPKLLWKLALADIKISNKCGEIQKTDEQAKTEFTNRPAYTRIYYMIKRKLESMRKDEPIQ